MRCDQATPSEGDIALGGGVRASVRASRSTRKKIRTRTYTSNLLSRQRKRKTDDFVAWTVIEEPMCVFALLLGWTSEIQDARTQTKLPPDPDAHIGWRSTHLDRSSHIICIIFPNQSINSGSSSLHCKSKEEGGKANYQSGVLMVKRGNRRSKQKEKKKKDDKHMGGVE